MKSFVLFVVIFLTSNIAVAFENERPVFSSHENVPELTDYLNANSEVEKSDDVSEEDLDDDTHEDGTRSPLGKFFQESVTACSIM